MSDIAFSLSLERDRLRFTSPSCREDYKKGSLSLAIFTIIYSTICGGLMVNNLIDVSTAKTYNGTEHYEVASHRNPSEITVTKVMYVVLICQTVLLIFSSFMMVRGIFHKQENLVLTWILVMLTTVIYAAVVIIRDFQLEGETSVIYTKTILYVIFLLTELILLKHPVKAYRKIPIAREAANRRATARYNSQNPEQAIITVSGAIEAADPNSLFKLPSYEEATAENNTTPNPGEDQQGKDPLPHHPPEYVP